jgi:hypothetical protein
MFEKKYKILFIRKQFNAYFIVKVIQTNKIEKMIGFSGKEFAISVENPLYIVGSQKVYILDIDKGSQLTLLEAKANMTPEELDLIVGQKIIRELTSGVIDNKKEKLLNMLIGFAFGALLAALVAIVYYTGQIQQLTEDWATQNNTIVIQ